MKSCLIFDMDGLLFDTERLVMNKLQRACADRGVTLSKEQYRQCIGQSFEKTAKFFTDSYNISDASEMLATIEREIHTQTAVPLKDGARELLQLAQSRTLTMAVGTTSKHAIASRYTQAQDIDSYFSTIVGGDQVAELKPSPHIYQEVLRRLRLRPDQAVVLEDSYYGTLSAHRAGLRVAHVPDLFEADPRAVEISYAVYPTLHAVAADLDHLLL